MDGFTLYREQFGANPLADNALYMIGECRFSQKKYAQAIEVFDQLILDYPMSDKIAAAYLKKGFALAELKKKPEAVAVLKLLISKYPTRRRSRASQGEAQGTAGHQMRDQNSLNKVILIGRIGQRPEIRHLPQGDRSVARFTMATNETVVQSPDQPGHGQDRVAFALRLGKAGRILRALPRSGEADPGRRKAPDPELAGPRREQAENDRNRSLQYRPAGFPGFPGRRPRARKSTPPTATRAKTPPRPIFRPTRNPSGPSAKTMSPF